MSFDVALLDVNVLIALFDNKHQHHSIASMWLINHVKSGGKWASCPITQNGCLRILSTKYLTIDAKLFNPTAPASAAADNAGAR